jgi:catechol 2,3-dioxygenase-like lactoylglutathione lyase family enzyme
MIQGGTPTIYVTDMDRAIAFYTKTLGLRLLEREDDDWASIDAGDGLVLGLQPAGQNGGRDVGKGGRAAAGGSISIGFNVTAPLEEVIAELENRGVQFRGPIQGQQDLPIRLAFFGDPDGNALYLCELGEGEE